MREFFLSKTIDRVAEFLSLATTPGKFTPNTYMWILEIMNHYQKYAEHVYLNFRNHCVFFLQPLSKCYRHCLNDILAILHGLGQPKLPKNFEEDTWAILKDAITAIFLKKKLSCDVEKLYQVIFLLLTLQYFMLPHEHLNSIVVFCTVGCWWSLSAQARSKPLWTNQERMWNTHSWKNISISGSKPRFGCIFVSCPKNMAIFLRSNVDYSWYCFTSWRKICQECCKYLFCVGYGVAAVPQASITVSGDWTQNCNWPSQIDWEWEVWLFFCNKFCLWYVHVML